jgi:hypothetical protein
LGCAPSCITVTAAAVCVHLAHKRHITGDAYHRPLPSDRGAPWRGERVPQTRPALRREAAQAGAPPPRGERCGRTRGDGDKCGAMLLLVSSITLVLVSSLTGRCTQAAPAPRAGGAAERQPRGAHARSRNGTCYTGRRAPFASHSAPSPCTRTALPPPHAAHSPTPQQVRAKRPPAATPLSSRRRSSRARAHEERGAAVAGQARGLKAQRPRLGL